MPTTTLLVIDIQRGAFDGVRYQPIDSPAPFVAKARALVDAARAGGRPVVFVQHCETTSGELFEEGCEQWRLHQDLQAEPGNPRETVLKKYASSAFENTDLDARLKALGADTLIVCGLQSEFCVSKTTRSALALGYQVLLAEDGHNTWPAHDGQRSAAQIRAEVNLQLAQAGAALAPTERLAAQLAAG